MLSQVTPALPFSKRNWYGILFWILAWALMWWLDGLFVFENLALMLVLASAIAGLWLGPLTFVSHRCIFTLLFSSISCSRIQACTITIGIEIDYIALLIGQTGADTLKLVLVSTSKITSIKVEICCDTFILQVYYTFKYFIQEASLKLLSII